MAVGDVYELVAEWTSGFQTGLAAQVLHYVVTGQESGKSDLEFATMMMGQYVGITQKQYLPTLANVYRLSNIAIIGISSPSFRHDFAQSVTGTGSTSTMSMRSAVVVKKQTAIRGRRFQGRMFLLSPSEDVCANGQINATHVAVLRQYVTALMTLHSPAVGTAIMGVYSREQSKASGSPVITPVTSMQVRSILGTIRGRRRVS